MVFVNNFADALRLYFSGIKISDPDIGKQVVSYRELDAAVGDHDEPVGFEMKTFKSLRRSPPVIINTWLILFPSLSPFDTLTHNNTQ